MHANVTQHEMGLRDNGAMGLRVGYGIEPRGSGISMYGIYGVQLIMAASVIIAVAYCTVLYSTRCKSFLLGSVISVGFVV